MREQTRGPRAFVDAAVDDEDDALRIGAPPPPLWQVISVTLVVPAAIVAIALYAALP